MDKRSSIVRARDSGKIIRNISKWPRAVRNNGGGHYNHSLFWTILSPEGGAPTGALADAINAAFGNLDEFKKQFGLTPFQYLTQVRVERAKELTIQTNLSIGKIAAMVGFADVHTFGRMFKQQTGVSLSQFSNSLTLIDFRDSKNSGNIKKS